MVRKMDPGYSGHRPRVQLMQGESDSTISYNNTGESIKEWTNVLGQSMTPTSTDKSYKGEVATWDRQFWKNSCGYQVLEAWSAPGQGHSMSYEEAAMLTFFGSTAGSTMDPSRIAPVGARVVGSGIGTADRAARPAAVGPWARAAVPAARRTQARTRRPTGGVTAADSTGGTSGPGTGGAVGSGGTNGARRRQRQRRQLCDRQWRLGERRDPRRQRGHRLRRHGGIGRFVVKRFG